MNVLSSDLDNVLKDVQGMLREGMPTFDANADSLSWLNVSSIFISAIPLAKLSASSIFFVQRICSKLTDLCKILHKFLSEKSRTDKKVIETFFLCLRQLICCISYLEKVLKAEKRDKITLMVSDWTLNG